MTRGGAVDGIIVLGILFLLAIPISIIALMVGHARLRGRIAYLEQRIDGLNRAADQDRYPAEPVASADVPNLSSPALPVIPAEPSKGAVTIAAVAPQSLGAWFGNAAPPLQARVAPAKAAADAVQNRALVISGAQVAALGAWLQANWVLVVAAVSLALAGVFFVQYGAERGLLPPPLRVLAAIAFGGALIAGGEWVRRRQGDDAGPTVYLPSTFSGAGVVSMFAGVLAARQMYGLIGPEMALLGLVSVAVVALVLGWFYGPFLAAIGLIGATVAPFVVGGSSPDLTWLYGYFTLIAALGLGIDTLRRWAWISVLSLVLGVAGGGLLFLDRGQAVPFGVMLVVLVLASIIIPGRSLVPRHGGITISSRLLGRVKSVWPRFPTQLAGGMMVTAMVMLAVVKSDSSLESLVLLALLAALSVAISLWASKATALADLAAIPAAGFLARLVNEAVNDGALLVEMQNAVIAVRLPETGPPVVIGPILLMVVAMAAAAALRSLAGRDHRIAWAGMAVGLPPAAMGVLEAFWYPAQVIGEWPWALWALGLAGGMVGLAVVFAQRDGKDDHRRMVYAALSALVLIPFALFSLLETAALTLSLAALVVAAVALDRRFRLPELGWFMQAGIIVLGWRLFLDPGVLWAFEAATGPVVLSFSGAIAAMVAALWLLRGMNRKVAKAFLDSGFVAFGAVFADVLLFRWLDAAFPQGAGGHWAATLIALPWLVMALVQMYRARLGGFMAKVRLALAAFAGVIAALGLMAAVTILNPLFSGEAVGGPMPFDTLFVAYALPGLILLLARRVFPAVTGRLGQMFLVAGAGFLALYAGLEIRRFWQGPTLSNFGTTQGELYTYTVALLLLGGAALYQAIASRSPLLRRVGMGIIGLTIAKVFLIDISGLSGLTRVAAFLALGLSLAGLAWLNRWAAERSRQAG